MAPPKKSLWGTTQYDTLHGLCLAYSSNGKQVKVYETYLTKDKRSLGKHYLYTRYYNKDGSSYTS